MQQRHVGVVQDLDEPVCFVQTLLCRAARTERPMKYEAVDCVYIGGFQAYRGNSQ